MNVGNVKNDVSGQFYFFNDFIDSFLKLRRLGAGDQAADLQRNETLVKKRRRNAVFGHLIRQMSDNRFLPRAAFADQKSIGFSRFRQNVRQPRIFFFVAD